jgi:hypothetical protein
MPVVVQPEAGMGGNTHDKMSREHRKKDQKVNLSTGADLRRAE